jgi:hypothetical protein
MKNKEGRDYVVLSNTVASVKDDVIYISDTGATISLSLADWKKLVTFINKKVNEIK